MVIGADLVPTKSNTELFIDGDVDRLIGERLKDVLSGASNCIFNLEVPLADEEQPIIKQGPNLVAPTATINGYKAIGADILTLANNHILDQGVQGLESTLKELDMSGIHHLGTGENLLTASEPFVFDFAGKKVGVYACVEHEFSVATDRNPGANPFDPLWSFDHVQELKNKVDYVIVLYHGGKEHYRYPSPGLQKICRRFVDKGVNLVICQHSHCIGCEEKYKGATIVYGQGNFIFDDSNDECWQTSLLININDDFSISYIPLVKAGNGVRMASDQKAEEILANFNERSKEIRKPDFIHEKYQSFADSFLEFYLRAFSGEKSIVFRTLNKLSKGSYMKRYLRKIYGKHNKVRIANYIDCEAHKELISQAIAKEYKEL